MPDFTDYVNPKVDELMDKLANFRQKIALKTLFGFGNKRSQTANNETQSVQANGIGALSEVEVESMVANGDIDFDASQEINFEERFAKMRAEENALNERIYGKKKADEQFAKNEQNVKVAAKPSALPVSKLVEKPSTKPVLKSNVKPESVSGKNKNNHSKDKALASDGDELTMEENTEMTKKTEKERGKSNSGQPKLQDFESDDEDDDFEKDDESAGGDKNKNDVGSPEDEEIRHKLEKTSWSRVKTEDQIEAEDLVKTASNGFSKLRSMSAEDILSGRHDISDFHIFSSKSLKLKPELSAQRDAEHERIWHRIQETVAKYGYSKLVMSTENMLQLGNIIAKSANRDRIMEDIMCDKDVMDFFTSSKKDYKYLITRSEGREFGHYVPDYSRDSKRMFEQFFCNPGKLLEDIQDSPDAEKNTGAMSIVKDLSDRFMRSSFTKGSDEYFSSGFLTTKPAIKVEEGNAKLLTLPNMAFDQGGSERGRKMAQIMHANCKANRGKTFITTVAVTSPKTSGHDIVLCCESSPKNGDIERILVSDSMMYNYNETLYMLEPAIEELFKAGALSKPLAKLVKDARKLNWDHDKICENKKLMQQFLKLCPEPAGDLQKTQPESSNMCMRNSLDNAFDFFLAAKDGKIETDENGRMSDRQRQIIIKSNPLYSSFDPENGGVNNRVAEAFRTYVNNERFFERTMDSIRSEMILKSTRKPEDITKSIAIIASKIFKKDISPSDVSCSLDIKDKGVVMNLKINGCSSHQFDMVMGDMIESAKIDAIRDVSYASASSAFGSSSDKSLNVTNAEIMAKIRANICDKLDYLAHDSSILDVAANAAKKEDDIGKLQIFKNMICEFLVRHGLKIKRERHIVLANKSAYLDSSFSQGAKSIKAIVHSSELQKQVSKMAEGHTKTLNKQKRRALEKKTSFSTEDSKSPNAFSSKDFGKTQSKDSASLDGSKNTSGRDSASSDSSSSSDSNSKSNSNSGSVSNSTDKKIGFVERLKNARALISSERKPPSASI